MKQNAKERLLKKVEEKVLLLFTKKSPPNRTLIGDCRLGRFTTKYMLLLSDDGAIKEMGRELEWY